MLAELHLENFRGFERHSVPLRATTFIVGRNNAGKSTIVEALRLISLVAARYEYLNFSRVPSWLDVPMRYRGVAPSLRGMAFDFEGVFHRYRDPPAIVTADFDNGASIRVYLGPDDQIHSVILDEKGEPLATKRDARKFALPPVAILPQVAPLAREERILAPQTIRSALFTTLASSHFRNQLNYYYDQYFDAFRTITEENWPGLRVRELRGRGTWPEDRSLFLLVQDGDFVAEAAWMGHGLQMWLQTMWFLTLASAGSTVILDEPDVYMHPDLQRQLVRYLRGRFTQTIVATHSVEIMSEAAPDAVLLADRSRRRSSFATSLPAVQRVVDEIGGVHVLQLSRLWTSRRCILVEGKDVKLLKMLHDTLFPDAVQAFDAFPNFSIGGWDGWPNAIGSSQFMKNSIDEDIVTYCILDSDSIRPS